MTIAERTKLKLERVAEYMSGEYDSVDCIGDPDLTLDIQAHVEKTVGSIMTVQHEVGSELIHVDIYVVAPTPELNFYTLVTSGMSEFPMTVPEGYEADCYAELCMFLPPTWLMSDDALEEDKNNWPFGILPRYARIPIFQNSWLWMEHTLANGDPPSIINSTHRFTGFMLTPAFLLPTEFWKLNRKDGQEINFLCVVPLYTEEIDYCRKFGVIHDQDGPCFFNKLARQSSITLEQVMIVTAGRKNLCEPKKRFGLF